jgi:HAD superfamily hydrolase (TIGR01509 family)
VSAPDGGRLQAVLWDMDGTLVDTEPYWIAAEYELVESFGGRWSEDHAHALIGQPLLVSAAYIREHSPVSLPPEAIVDRLQSSVIAAVHRQVEWRPGVRRLLSQLKAAQVRTAMVTMSYASLAGAVAGKLPAGTFDTLVTGDQVRNGKPHPESYLLAAQRLGVDPEFCIAIEDSPAGIASAEAAGCVVLAVPNQVAAEPAPSRTIVDTLAGVELADLADLIGLHAPA